MSIPSTLSLVGSGLGLVGGIVGARGAQQTGRATVAAAGFNRDIGLINARQARAAAGAGVEQIRYGGARLMGAQRAGYGAAGVDLSSGSPLDVYGDTASQIKLAELVRFYEGEVAATEAENKANIAAMSGVAAGQAADTNATASLLGGAGSAIGGLSRVNWANIF
jgi:hypothetical protein